MKINRFLKSCAILGMIALIPITAHGATIETVTVENGLISVEGISSTEMAVIEVKKQNSTDTEYIALIDEIGEDGNFSYSFNLKDAEGFYTLRLNDGISGQIPAERSIYIGERFLADRINIDRETAKVGDKLTANSNVSNLSGESANVRFFAAVYDKNDALISINSSETLIEAESSVNAELTFDVPAMPDIEKVKIMLWDDLQKPLAIPVEIDIECLEIYVSLSGSDDNNGSLEAPFETIERALTEAEIMKNEGSQNVAVYIREGEYSLDSLNLDSSNSGVIISGYPEEKVILSGSEKLNSGAFKLVEESDSEYSRLLDSAKGKVYKCDLNEFGIDSAGTMPDIKMWGGFEPFDVVTVNGRKLHVARYPNEGYESIEKAISCTDTEMIFRYSGNRAERWIGAEDAWVIGYWGKGWAQDAAKISSIDTTLKLITTEGASQYGLTATLPGGRYYAYNLLEELDSEEEWYIDKNTNTLYLYSENGFKDSEIRIAAEKNTFISVKNASDISIRNLIIEDVKGYGISVAGSKNISVKDCILRNIARDAVQITGEACGVENCEIYNIDGGGITLAGGNRNLLTSSGNFAVNNSIHDYALEYRVYRPGIRMNGVGCVVANNEIYNAPHSAVMYNGNEHIIEYNYIHDCLTETADAGAIYSGQDFLSHGTVIRYNHIENIDTESDPAYGYAVGIYLDDYYAGGEVYGNIMNNVDLGFLLGGGRNNAFQNNIIMNAPEGTSTVILGDRRDGDSWSSSRETILAKTEDIDYLNETWQKKYPETAELMSDNPELPKYNSICNNVIYRHGEYNIADVIKTYGTVKNNISISTDDLGFVDEAGGNFKLRKDSIIFTTLPEFEDIPFEKIGRYE